MEDLVSLSVKELERLWEKRRDELIAIRKEIDRKKGLDKIPAEVDFEKYVTR